LKAFLVMNDKKSEWFCPLCDKSAKFESLFVDSFFTEILNKSKKDKIQFLTPEDWMDFYDTKKSLSAIDDSECIVIE